LSTFQPSWSKILEEAVTKPGVISEAYRTFHNYSTGNQILALIQCYERGLQPGPISTYPSWQKLGRQVRKGEKAITLCMPVQKKRRHEAPLQDKQEGEVPQQKDDYYTLFVYRPNWFLLSQTEGEPYKMPDLPQWSKERALAELQISEVPFQDLNGNTLGYARKREVAVSPICPFPHKTLFHEIGHVELGHTSEIELFEERVTPRNLMEVEAESVALLCLESLQLPDSEHARGYIQSYLHGENIPEKSAQKIFGAADKILKAGYRLNSPE
jgi:antirestriction protein ArdC